MHKKILIAIGITILFLRTCITPIVAIDNVRNDSIPISDGKTLYVGGTGPDNYTRIQDAIDDASDGDTVFVFDDSSPYYERIEINKSGLSLIGENKETTFINGSSSGDVVIIRADEVTITGFSIFIWLNMDDKAGIFILSCCNNIYNNIIISYGTCNGIHIYESSNNLISENIFQEVGSTEHGIYLEKSDFNMISKNVLYKCKMRLDESNQNIISFNKFTDVHNGISMIDCKDNRVNENEMIYNYPGDKLFGRGIFCRFGGNHRIYGNIISGFEGGICCIPNNNNLIEGNIIKNSTQNGIHVKGRFNTIEGNVIQNSISKGIHVGGSFNTIEGNVIENNPLGLKLMKGNINRIKENNFIGNTIHAYFEQSYINKWSRNYWENNFEPYYIIKGVNIIPIIDLDPWDYDDPHITFQWYNIDWHPAKEPYDIGV